MKDPRETPEDVLSEDPQFEADDEFEVDDELDPDTWEEDALLDRWMGDDT